jgi:hypothetical protein
MTNSDPINQLADVELPFPPDWSAWIAAGAMIVVLSALLAAHLYWRRRGGALPGVTAESPAMELQRLDTAWLGQRLAAREYAYRLAALLCHVLRVPQLPRECPSAISDGRSAWPEIVAALEQLRYRQHEVMTLSEDQLTWIREWIRATDVQDV